MAFRTACELAMLGLLAAAAGGAHAAPAPAPDGASVDTALLQALRRTTSDVTRHESQIRLLVRAVTELTGQVRDLTDRIAALEERFRRLEVYATGSTSMPVSEERWNELRRGMDKDRVRELLGDPQRIQAGSRGQGEAWYYFGRGTVFFDGRGRVGGAENRIPQLQF